MAAGFNLTAQLNLKGPTNVSVIVADIKKQLGSINATVNLTVAPAATTNINKLNAALLTFNKTLQTTTGNANATAVAIRNLGTAIGSINSSNLPQVLNNSAAAANKLTQASANNAKQLRSATSEMTEFGRQAGLAFRRFSAITSVTSVIYGLTNAVNNGIRAYIDYDKELIKLQQVTGQSAAGLKGLETTITSLATGLGVGSAELTQISSTLAQAGLSARDTERALKALALSSLAPSFDSMNETVEGSIALMRQFGINAGDLEKALGSVNSVAAKFAVEAADLITAIQRTGGVFATASKGVSEGTDALNEFLAVFTSIRATTRESAETIATGLRTIFTRIQRGDTIQALKEYGVNLQDLDGKFVGAYKAVELLSKGLGGLDPRDLRFSKIVEELGGFRQIGKVIPLIQQFATAQDALKVAQTGQGSLAADAAKAQESLAVQIAKTREQFLALFRDIGKSDSFQAIAKGALSVTSALIKAADSIKGILPVLGVMLAFKGASAAVQFGSGFLSGIKGAGGAKGLGNRMGGGPGMNSGGLVRRFASGGLVPGSGDTDSVDAKLMPGEFVMKKAAVKAIGTNTLHKMNTYSGGGRIKKFARGGAAIDRIDSIDEIKDGDTFTANVIPKTKPFKQEFRIAEWDAWEKANNYNPDALSRASSNKYREIKSLEKNQQKNIQKLFNEQKKQVPGIAFVEGNRTASSLATGATQALRNSLKSKKPEELQKGISGKFDYFGRSIIEGINIDDIYKTGRTFGYNRGGKIQKFLMGGTVEETAQLENLSLQDAILAQVKELGGIPGIKKLNGVSLADRTLDSLLRANVVKKNETVDPRAVKAVNDALSNEEGKNIRRAQQINKSQKLAVVGLQPFDKSEEISFKIPGFEDSTIFVRGLSKQYSDAVSNMRQQLEDTIDKFGTDIQNTMIFGGNSPLALDFDETLVSGADIFGADGRPDIPAYSDLNKVAEALNQSKVKLTPLGEKIKELVSFDPSFLNRIRVLTARPQSNAALLSQKLNEFGIPLGSDKITGVSGGNKGTAMGVAERLIDDNIKNIRDAKKEGKSAVQYAELRRLSEEEKAATGNANAEGAILEAVLSKLGAVGGSVQNRAIDFENGLGMSAAQAFPGIAPDWPTEVKRTLSSDNIGRAKEEFTRYYAENYGPWPQQEDAFGFDKAGKPMSRFFAGGLVRGYKLGGEVYNLEKTSGLSNREFDEAVRFGNMAEYSMEEFQGYLEKLRKNKQSRSNIKTDKEALRQSLMSGTPTSTAKQLALADMLKGPADAGYRPILTEAQRIAQARSDVRDATRYAGGGGVTEEEQKKEKQYGQIGLKIGSSRITAEYLRQGMGLLASGSMRAGEVTADKSGNIYTVQSAGATDGFGPKLYDIVMEAATANGSMLTSDRHSVSDDAYRVWNYYFKNRGDVKKTPLSPENWYHGQKWFDQSKFPSEDPKTWAPKSDDAWTLLTGYSKAPSLINDPKLVQRLASGGAVQLYHGSNTGVNDSVLESFKKEGAKSNIAQGYGQGAGFYLYSGKEKAKQQAQMRVNGGLGSFAVVSGDTAGKPMVLTFKEMLDPATWDLDYELNKGSVVKWLAENYDQIKAKVAPGEKLTGIKDIVNADSSKGIMSQGIKIQSDTGSRKTIYSGTDSNLREGELLGQIMSRLQASDPKIVGDFENTFFKSPSLASGEWDNLALKYVGSSPLKPTNIETFAKGGHVMAMLTPGEAVLSPESASQIGKSNLDRLNHAEKYIKRNSGGGISIVPGSGDGDTFGPVPLAVGSYVIRKKATAALGLGKYNVGGSVQSFATGGMPIPVRPDIISRATVKIDDKSLEELKKLEQIIAQLGIASSTTSQLLLSSKDISYKAAEKAMKADLERIKISAAGIDQIIAAENALKAVRAQSSDDVKKRQAMEGAFSGVSGKSSGAVQQEISLMADSRASKQISTIEKSRLDKNEKSLITEKKTKDYDQTVADLTRANPLGYVGDIQKEASKRVMQRSAAGKYDLTESEKSDVRSRSSVSDEEKRNIYRSQTLKATAQVTGVSQSSLSKAGVGADDVRKYVQESMMDRKALAQMDAQYRTIRMAELQAAGKTATEAKALVEQELADRRAAANAVAAEKGVAGPGGTGLRGDVVNFAKNTYNRVDAFNERTGINSAARGLSKYGGSAALGIAAVAGQGDRIAGFLTDDKKSQARIGSAISAGGGTLASGVGMAASAAAIPVVGPYIAALTLAGTAVAAFSEGISAAGKATREFEQNVRTKRVEDAGDKLDRSMEELQKSPTDLATQNKVLQNVRNLASENSMDTAGRLKDAQAEKAGTRSWYGFITQAKAPTLDNDDMNDFAKQRAKASEKAASGARIQIESQMESGKSFSDIKADPGFKELAGIIAEASPEFQLAKTRIALMSDAAVKATGETREELIAKSRNAEITKLESDAGFLNKSRTLEAARAMEEANKAGRKLSMTFNSMVNSFNQALGKLSYQLDNLANATNDAIDALSGEAKIGKVSSKDQNVLENPDAYDEKTKQETSKRMADFIVNPNAAGLDPLEKKRRQEEATRIEQTLNSDPDKIGRKSAGAIATFVKDNANADINTVAPLAKNELMAQTKDLPQQMRDAMTAKFDEIVKNVEKMEGLSPQQKTDKLAQILEDELGTAAAGSAKALKDMASNAAKFRADTINRFIDSVNRATKAQLQATQIFNKAKDLRTESNISLREMKSGGSIGLGERQRIVNDKVARLTGGETDPNKISENIQDQESQRPALQEIVADESKSAEDRMKAAKSLADLDLSINKNKEALDELANSTELASAAMEQLQTLQKMQADRLQNLDQVLTSTPQELQKLNESLIRVQQRAMGINPGPSRDAKRAYDMTLRQTGGNRFLAMQAGQAQMAQDRGTDLRTMEQYKSNFMMQYMNNNQGASMEDAENEYKKGAANLRGQMAYESGAINIPGARETIMADVDPTIDPAFARTQQVYKNATENQAVAQEALGKLELVKSDRLLKDATDQLTKAFKDLPESFNQIQNNKLEEFNIKVAEKPLDEAVERRATTVAMTASTGKYIDFKPKGTDTVPAMLTPGEFVVNARSTAQHLPLLKAINSGTNLVGNTAMMSKGGIVYLEYGSKEPVEESGLSYIAGHVRNIGAENTVRTVDTIKSAVQGGFGIGNLAAATGASPELRTAGDVADIALGTGQAAYKASNLGTRAAVGAGGTALAAGYGVYALQSAATHGIALSTGEAKIEDYDKANNEQANQSYLKNVGQNLYDPGKAAIQAGIATNSLLNPDSQENQNARNSIELADRQEKMLKLQQRDRDNPSAGIAVGTWSKGGLVYLANGGMAKPFREILEEEFSRPVSTNPRTAAEEGAARFAAPQLETANEFPTEAAVDRNAAAATAAPVTAEPRKGPMDLVKDTETANNQAEARVAATLANDPEFKGTGVTPTPETTGKSVVETARTFKMTDAEMYAGQAQALAPKSIKDIGPIRNMGDAQLAREAMARGMTIAEIRYERQQRGLSRFSGKTRESKERELGRGLLQPSERMNLMTKAQEAQLRQSQGGDPYADQKTAGPADVSPGDVLQASGSPKSAASTESQARTAYDSTLGDKQGRFEELEAKRQKGKFSSQSSLSPEEREEWQGLYRQRALETTPSRTDNSRRLALMGIDPKNRTPEQQEEYLRLRFQKDADMYTQSNGMAKTISGAKPGENFDDFKARQVQRQRDTDDSRYSALKKSYKEEGRALSDYDKAFVKRYKTEQLERQKAVLGTIEPGKDALTAQLEGAEAGAKANEDLLNQARIRTDEYKKSKEFADDQASLQETETQRDKDSFNEYLFSLSKQQPPYNGDPRSAAKYWISRDDAEGDDKLSAEDKAKILLSYEKQAADFLSSKDKVSSISDSDQMKYGRSSEGRARTPQEIVELKYNEKRDDQLKQINDRVYSGLAKVDTRADDPDGLSKQAIAYEKAAKELSQIKNMDNKGKVEEYTAQAEAIRARVGALRVASAGSADTQEALTQTMKSATGPQTSATTARLAAAQTDKSLDQYAADKEAKQKVEQETAAAAAAEANRVAQQKAQEEAVRQQQVAAQQTAAPQAENRAGSGGFLGWLGNVASSGVAAARGATTAVVGGALTAASYTGVVDWATGGSAAAAESARLDQKVKQNQEQLAARGVLGPAGTDQAAALREAQNKVDSEAAKNATASGDAFRGVTNQAVVAGAQDVAGLANAVSAGTLEQGLNSVGGGNLGTNIFGTYGQTAVGNLNTKLAKELEDSGNSGLAFATNFANTTAALAFEAIPIVASLGTSAAGSAASAGSKGTSVLGKLGNALSYADNLVSAPGSLVGMGKSGLKAVDNVLGGIGSKTGKMLDNVFKFSEMGADLSKAGRGALDFAQPLLEMAGKGLEKTSLGKGLKGVAQGVGDFIGGARYVGDEMLGTLNRGWSSLKGGVRNTTSRAMGGIGRAASSATDAVTSRINKASSSTIDSLGLRRASGVSKSSGRGGGLLDSVKIAGERSKRARELRATRAGSYESRIANRQMLDEIAERPDAATRYRTGVIDDAIKKNKSKATYQAERAGIDSFHAEHGIYISPEEKMNHRISRRAKDGVPVSDGVRNRYNQMQASKAIRETEQGLGKKLSGAERRRIAQEDFNVDFTRYDDLTKRGSARREITRRMRIDTDNSRKAFSAVQGIEDTLGTSLSRTQIEDIYRQRGASGDIFNKANQDSVYGRFGATPNDSRLDLSFNKQGNSTSVRSSSRSSRKADIITSERGEGSRFLDLNTGKGRPLTPEEIAQSKLLDDATGATTKPAAKQPLPLPNKGYSQEYWDTLPRDTQKNILITQGGGKYKFADQTVSQSQAMANDAISQANSRAQQQIANQSATRTTIVGGKPQSNLTPNQSTVTQTVQKQGTPTVSQVQEALAAKAAQDAIASGRVQVPAVPSTTPKKPPRRPKQPRTSGGGGNLLSVDQMTFFEKLRTPEGLADLQARSNKTTVSMARTPTKTLSNGGIVYASNGAFINARPRGTDTVPAMLTPGEFVINRQAAQQHMPVLQAINSGAYSQGGVVKYLAAGGPANPLLGGLARDRADEYIRQFEEQQKIKKADAARAAAGGYMAAANSAFDNLMQNKQNIAPTVNQMRPQPQQQQANPFAGMDMSAIKELASSLGGLKDTFGSLENIKELGNNLQSAVSNMGTTVNSFGEHISHIPGQVLHNVTANVTQHVTGLGDAGRDILGQATSNANVISQNNVARVVHNLHTNSEGAITGGNPDGPMGRVGGMA